MYAQCTRSACAMYFLIPLILKITQQSYEISYRIVSDTLLFICYVYIGIRHPEAIGYFDCILITL